MQALAGWNFIPAAGNDDEPQNSVFFSFSKEKALNLPADGHPKSCVAWVVCAAVGRLPQAVPIEHEGLPSLLPCASLL